MTISREALEKRIGELPSLSTTVVEILNLFERDTPDMHTLEQLINRDQALASRLLRLANSPYFGFTANITTVKMACVVLGLQAIYNIVVATAIIDRFPPNKSAVFDRLAFWQHAVGAGVAAKVLAKHLGEDEDVAFVSGLVHDIGKLVLDAHFPSEFAQILGYRDGHDCLIREAEQAVLGYDHCRIGLHVARQWKFPPAIQAAISGHHRPDHAPANLTDIVHVADILARALEMGDGGDGHIPELCQGALERLALTMDRIRRYLPEIERLYADNRVLLNGSAAAA